MMPDNPVVGGTVLRRAAIRSPNYVLGVSGWTINQDGSAEFNNLTIRGTFAGTDFVINSAGAFFYKGTPAAGNLIASIASNDGTDAFGNAYIGSGGLGAVTAYTTTGSPLIAEVHGNGQTLYYTATTQAGPWTSVTVGMAYSKLNGANFLVLEGGALNLLSFSGSPMAVLEGLTAVNPATLNTQETLHALTTGFPAGVSGVIHYGWTGLLWPQTYVQVGLTLAATTTINNGTTLATLPANYPPAGIRRFMAAYSAHGVAGDTPLPIEIDTSGNVIMSGASFTSPAGGTSGIQGNTAYQ